jgi:dolichyl-phosphate beta-glucosyltransferase
MHGLHFCLRTLGVGHIQDTQCGFKVRSRIDLLDCFGVSDHKMQMFSREAARSLFPSMHIAHWIFDVELLLHAHLIQIPIVEVPIGWHEVQGSKISLVSDSIVMLRDLVILRANFALGRWTIGDEGRPKID